MNPLILVLCALASVSGSGHLPGFAGRHHNAHQPAYQNLPSGHHPGASGAYPQVHQPSYTQVQQPVLPAPPRSPSLQPQHNYHHQTAVGRQTSPTAPAAPVQYANPAAAAHPAARTQYANPAAVAHQAHPAARAQYANPAAVAHQAHPAARAQYTNPAAAAPGHAQYVNQAAPASHAQYVNPAAPTSQAQFANPAQYVNPAAPAGQPQYVNPAAAPGQAQYVNSAAAAPAAYPYNNVPTTTHTPIDSQYQRLDQYGQYTFGFSGGDSDRSETRDAQGNVRGSYTYIDSDGKTQTQYYVADELGFRVTGTNLPKGPGALASQPGPAFQQPATVQDTPEVAAAKANFMKAFEEAALLAKEAPDPVQEQLSQSTSN